MTTTITHPQRVTHVTSATPLRTYVTLGADGKGGYIVAPMNDIGYVEVQWDSSMPGCTEYVVAGRLTVPTDGPDYRPAHLRPARVECPAAGAARLSEQRTRAEFVVLSARLRGMSHR